MMVEKLLISKKIIRQQQISYYSAQHIVSLPFILSCCFAKCIWVESRNFVNLNWFSLHTMLRDLLYCNSLYYDDASISNKLFGHFLIHLSCFACFSFVQKFSLELSFKIERLFRMFTQGTFLAVAKGASHWQVISH